MKFLKSNILSITTMTFLFAAVMMGDASAETVFGVGATKLVNLFKNAKMIIFIIGGSIGLGKEVLEKSDYALSFSRMTFPHQLMKVILLEQIYRSYRIMKNEPYHK